MRLVAKAKPRANPEQLRLVISCMRWVKRLKLNMKYNSLIDLMKPAWRNGTLTAAGLVHSSIA